MTSRLPPTCAGQRSFYARSGKRMFDFTLAFVLAIACSIPVALIALATLLFSGPPVLFRQTRIGRGGKPFTICKFRTMRLRSDVAGSVTVAGDPRVTPFGRLLRMYKLDELPQLWNILRGDMSFVGPRPEVPEYADLLQGQHSDILSVRPGITGPATIAYAYEEAVLAAQDDPASYNKNVIYPHKIVVNREYVRRITLAQDLRWMFQTALVCFKHT